MTTIAFTPDTLRVHSTSNISQLLPSTSPAEGNGCGCDFCRASRQRARQVQGRII